MQSVYECQQVFSAAVIGAVEARYSENDEVWNMLANYFLNISFSFGIIYQILTFELLRLL